MAERRKFNTYTTSLGEDGQYSSLIVPRDKDAQAHNAPIETTPWPDHKAFLQAKGQSVVDWAREHLPMVAANHVADFVRTRNKNCLATLTELERAMLNQACEDLQVGFKP